MNIRKLAKTFERLILLSCGGKNKVSKLDWVRFHPEENSVIVSVVIDGISKPLIMLKKPEVA
jgi:hypothetical protein